MFRIRTLIGMRGTGRVDDRSLTHRYLDIVMAQGTCKSRGDTIKIVSVLVNYFYEVTKLILVQ
jgi:hypothetical protein